MRGSNDENLKSPILRWCTSCEWFAFVLRLFSCWHPRRRTFVTKDTQMMSKEKLCHQEDEWISQISDFVVECSIWSVTKSIQEAAGFSFSEIRIQRVFCRAEVSKNPEKPRFSWATEYGIKFDPGREHHNMYIPPGSAPSHTKAPTRVEGILNRNPKWKRRQLLEGI